MTTLRASLRLFLLVLITSLLLPALPAHAQGAASAVITAPDTSKYPTITTYLDAFDDQGNFINNLGAGDVSILENGQQIRADKLESLPVPLDFVLAINSDATLGVRDNQGQTRYTKTEVILSTWAGARASSNPDNFGLAWNGGIVTSGLPPADWKTRLDNFDPLTRTSTGSLAALSYALDAAQEMQAGPGTKKVILLISPHLAVKDQPGVADLISRANQAGVRIFVWITDSAAYQENAGAKVLQNLALSTGGRYATFTGSETLPDLETWFSSLRNVYQITYSSKIRAGGTHSLSVQVNSNNLALTSPAVTFKLDVQPPNAALLSPPIQIVRQNPDSPFDLQSFKPSQQEISVLVEFPDGRMRALKRATLFVDGIKVAENTAEPFTHFTWDLSGYVASDEHSVQVEVEDVLGLTRMSAKVPVQVTVVQPPGGMAGLIMRNSAAVTISIMILAGAIVLGIIVLGGRRGLASLAERRKTRKADKDPVTQPIADKVEPPAVSGRTNPFPWLRRKDAAAPAYLTRLSPDGLPAETDPIPLNGREITFGTDPTQATVVLDDPSLALLHARLMHAQDDNFSLFDQGSIAGTWVNYDPIPPEGCLLKHWDVIHFGNLSFRFILAKPPAARKPTIAPIQDG